MARRRRRGGPSIHETAASPGRPSRPGPPPTSQRGLRPLETSAGSSAAAAPCCSPSTGRPGSCGSFPKKSISSPCKPPTRRPQPSRPPTAAASPRPTAASPGRGSSEAGRKNPPRHRSKGRRLSGPKPEPRPLSKELCNARTNLCRGDGDRGDCRCVARIRFESGSSAFARPGLDDAGRSGGAGGHGLQLRHRARARRAERPARAGKLRPEVHGHRRDGEPGDGALPLADRALAAVRPRAELRVRSARAGEAAAQVRRPRRHAGADADRERHHAARRR